MRRSWAQVSEVLRRARETAAGSSLLLDPMRERHERAADRVAEQVADSRCPSTCATRSSRWSAQT
jgi:hypothetical protein